MADPRIITPHDRLDVRSPLMRSKQESVDGTVPNFCPFGCDVEDLDENGYCYHLVGFTNDGKMMERFVYDSSVGRRRVLGNKKERVTQSHRLVQITTSCRVYDPKANPEDAGPKPEETPEVEYQSAKV